MYHFPQELIEQVFSFLDFFSIVNLDLGSFGIKNPSKFIERYNYKNESILRCLYEDNLEAFKFVINFKKHKITYRDIVASIKVENVDFFKFLLKEFYYEIITNNNYIHYVLKHFYDIQVLKLFMKENIKNLKYSILDDESCCRFKKNICDIITERLLDSPCYRVEAKDCLEAILNPLEEDPDFCFIYDDSFFNLKEKILLSVCNISIEEYKVLEKFSEPENQLKNFIKTNQFQLIDYYFRNEKNFIDFSVLYYMLKYRVSTEFFKYVDTSKFSPDLEKKDLINLRKILIAEIEEDVYDIDDYYQDFLNFTISLESFLFS